MWAGVSAKFWAQVLTADGGPVMYHAEVDTPREGWQFLLSRVDALWDTFPDDMNGALVEAHTTLHHTDQAKAGRFTTATPNGDADDEFDVGVAYQVLPYGHPDLRFPTGPID